MRTKTSLAFMLLMSALPSISSSNPQITGAFGIHLGKKYDGKVTAPSFLQEAYLPDNDLEYRQIEDPPIPNIQFTNYFIVQDELGITVAIYAYKMHPRQTCSEALTPLESALTRKYGMLTKTIINSDEYDGFFFESTTNRSVFAACQTLLINPVVGIFYADENLVSRYFEQVGKAADDSGL